METLVCVLTPPRTAALAVVHVVGTTLGLREPRRVVRRRIGDDVLARWIPAAEALSGRDTVEITCHGGRAAVDAVLEAVGGRRVSWDELVERAPLHETQKEAHRLLPKALTLRAARMLLDQAAGALARAEPTEALLKTARLGRALVEPLTVAIVGRPNAGKSTLLNALLEAERALVTPEAGTTRDPVRELGAVDGVPLWFVDTAGLGPPRDELDAEAMRRTESVMKTADLVLHVRDAPEPARGFAVDSKIDVAPPRDGLGVCALDGRGIPELRAAILRELGLDGDIPPGAPAVFTSRRQQWIMERIGGYVRP